MTIFGMEAKSKEVKFKLWGGHNSLSSRPGAKQLKYQQAGRVEQVGKHRYHYDANGRLIQKISQHDGCIKFEHQPPIQKWSVPLRSP